MFIYVHQGRFSSTRTDCVNFFLFIFCQHIGIHTHIREWFDGSDDGKGGIRFGTIKE
jgi:hypothetical protein